jgi:hypothetical protein
MSFGYPQLYANGLNNSSQLRRSTDFAYQRGATYEVVLTGSTYETSMELDVDLYANASKVGRMSVVPYDIYQSGSTFTYKFNVRPYDFINNFIEAQHSEYYWLNNWYETNQTINLNNPYPNKVQMNMKYGYRYISGVTSITEYSGSPTNNYNHYTDISVCSVSTGFTASGFTNTGEYFDLFGGSFEMKDRYWLPNNDQELGSVVGSSNVVNAIDANRRLSPIAQFLLDYPTTPEMSETSRFLTEAPRIQTIQEKENYTLFFFNGQTGDRQVIEADYAVFEFYDVNNNQIDYFEQEINFSGTSYQSPTGYTDNLAIWQLPCGPKDITNIFSTVNWDDVAYYRVQLFYSYPTNRTDRQTIGPVGPVSEAFYFYLYDNCGPGDTRIAFLNSRGGFDYFTFTKYRQDTKKIKRQTFDNRYYSPSVQGPDRNFGRTVKTFSTDVDEEFVIESDFINVQYGAWLQELFLSPQVYEVKDDYVSPLDRQDKVYKDLRPIQVLSTEVETITKKHKKLNKYRITMKYADGYFVSKGF